MGDEYAYDEYTVYITLPKGVSLDEVIDAGCEAMAVPVDDTKEIEWKDSHY